jgi:hypothetical protein
LDVISKSSSFLMIIRLEDRVNNAYATFTDLLTVSPKVTCICMYFVRLQVHQLSI